MSEINKLKALSHSEMQAVHQALLRGQPDATTDDVLEAIDWAEHIRLCNAVLSLVINGYLPLKVVDGGIYIALHKGDNELLETLLKHQISQGQAI